MKFKQHNQENQVLDKGFRIFKTDMYDDIITPTTMKQKLILGVFCVSFSDLIVVKLVNSTPGFDIFP